MSYEEFLHWDGPTPHLEWVDGRVVRMSPVNKEHAGLLGWLAALLQHFVEAHELGEVLCDPFQMKPAPHLPGRAPDIQFVATRNLHRIRNLFVDGPADLVVEIISPRSRVVDRRQKYAEYQEGGVPEYWLLDPPRKQAEFFLRNVHGSYQTTPLSSGGIYRSKMLPGLWLKETWLWQRPLPPLRSVLKEWRLI